MDLTFNEPELAFRDELRAWLADHDPGGEPDAEDANYEWRVDFQRALARDGWAAVHWPPELQPTASRLLIPAWARSRSYSAGVCPSE